MTPHTHPVLCILFAVCYIICSVLYCLQCVMLITEIFTIRNLHLNVMKSLTDVWKTLHALVTGRLDYAQSLLYGVSQATLQRLHRVQNCAACFVCRTRDYHHIRPVPQLFRWLSDCARPTYTVLVYVYLVTSTVLFRGITDPTPT